MDMKQANLLAIDSMADESAYPDGYNKQVSSWFSDLKVWFEDTQRPPHITTVAPADPPAAASCVPNPSDPVKDSHEGQLEKAAKYFCKEYASGIVQGPVVDIKQAVVSGAMPVGRGILNVARLYTGTENRDDVYDISIQSVKGCKSHGGFNLDTPVANNQCSDILHSAWKQCRFSCLLPAFLFFAFSLLFFSSCFLIERKAFLLEYFYHSLTRFRQQPRSWWIHRCGLSNLQHQH